VDSIDLVVRPGEFFTLLGPSGCGKSTLLRIIAGFEEPSGGRIFFDDRDVTDEPPNRRGIGFVFQNYALFPHLSVSENVAFGLKVRRVHRREVAARLRTALQDVSLADCGAERVDRLSGGQQQRVALARALVLRPGLLLLDEPLSNLDARLRQEARAVLQDVHRNCRTTIMYVTHDQAEALAMSDRIGILSAGTLHQVGSPEDIYERPATSFVADFVGRSLLLDAAVCGTDADRTVVRLQDGTRIAIDPERRAHDVDLRPGTRLGLCLRPESLILTSAGGTFRGVIAGVEYAGQVRLCHVATPVGTLHVEVARSTACPRTGEHVQLAVNASAVHLVRMEPLP
jgi:iron(III) transport system ATP-binding protein